jgi:hypothetical protein
MSGPLASPAEPVANPWPADVYHHLAKIRWLLHHNGGYGQNVINAFTEIEHHVIAMTDNEGDSDE